MWYWCTVQYFNYSPLPILSELLCILGAEGCVVDVDLRFSEAPNSKLRAITCIKWLWFTPTTQPAILSELPCILGGTSSGWSSTYSIYLLYSIYTVYGTLYSIYTVQYIHLQYYMLLFPFHPGRSHRQRRHDIHLLYIQYKQYISTVHYLCTVRLRARWRCSEIGTHHLNLPYVSLGPLGWYGNPKTVRNK